MNRELDHADDNNRYEPPRMTVIRLRPEEAVLGNCKTSSTGGPVQATCTFMVVCRIPGS
jgi:hypothetical protein